MDAVMIKLVTTVDSELLTLIQLLDGDLNARYGKIQEQYNTYNKLDNVEVAVIAFVEGIPAGCGCYKSFDRECVEIKRMFVKKEFRGQDVAAKILEYLEVTAKNNGFLKAVLETGIGQPEAIRFYSKCDYVKTDNYGQYVGNANSICMEKTLHI